MLEERQFVIQTRLQIRLDSLLTLVQHALADRTARETILSVLVMLVTMETRLVCQYRPVAALALRGTSARPVRRLPLQTLAAALRTTVLKEVLLQLRASSH